MPCQELRHIMKTLGDKLNDNEIDEMLEHADIEGDEHINYLEWVTSLN